MNQALWQAPKRRLPGCLYCGAELRHGRKYACAGHADLPEQDPHWRSATRRPLEAPPDLPVLILARKAA